MSSTKRRRHKNKRRPLALAAKSDASTSVPSSSPPETSAEAAPKKRTETSTERWWWWAALIIILVAAALRLYALELKPMHHDEGVNGFFLTNLVRSGIYKYDPSNYHGPTLYYLTLPSIVVFGLSTFAVRLVTALFGIATVALILALRRHLGTIGALAAASLIAVSPGSVFYSRYFIHEQLFVFFTLGIVVAVLYFFETRKTLYLMLAFASAALLFATKETAFVSVITLFLSWLVVKIAASSAFDSGRIFLNRYRRRSGTRQHMVANAPGKSRRAQLSIATAVILFIFLNVIFYSSFFSNWQGVGDSLSAFKIWSKTGTSEFHAKPIGTYFGWLLQEEAPILILAAIGSLIAVFEVRKNRFAVFAGAWAFGLLAAYSLIRYKTPWLMLSFIAPMAIVGGYALQILWRRRVGKWQAPLAAPGFILAVLISAYQTFVLNFRQYDNDQYIYVYSHTHREAQALVDKVNELAEREGNNQIGVNIAAPEYWPLPWYFRNNPSVGFSGYLADRYDPKATPLLIVRESADEKEDQVRKLRSEVGTSYQEVGVYSLRPGVRLALFARTDLAGG